MAQAIATNPQASIPVQTSHNPTRSAKAADPEPFNGNQDQTEEFIRAVWIVVTMQADTFVDERMKILYALSFMCGGTAQVWAANETMAVIMGTSQMQTLDIFLGSGKCRKDFQRPRSGMNGLRTASRAQNGTQHDSRGLHSSVRNARGQNQL